MVNHWEPIGLKYLTYYWLDHETQVILDSNDKEANECYNFIAEALDKGDSVLIHSVKGQNRACTILTVWIMRRYKWSLKKTLEFLHSRKPDFEMKTCFIQQLMAYENRLISQGLGPKTSKWSELYEATDKFENEELLVRNTYLNAQMGPFADFSSLKSSQQPSKVKWVDNSDVKNPIFTIIEDSQEIKPIEPPRNLTPIIKGITRNIQAKIKPVASDPIKPFKKTEEDKKYIVKEFTPISRRTNKINDKFNKQNVDAKARQVRTIAKSKPIPNTRPINNNEDNPKINKQHSINKELKEKTKIIKENNYTGPVTKIINQNNINNYIIQNPEKVQVIERIKQTNEPVIKKVTAKKIIAVRPSSANVKRDINSLLMYYAS